MRLFIVIALTCLAVLVMTFAYLSFWARGTKAMGLGAIPLLTIFSPLWWAITLAIVGVVYVLTRGWVRHT